LKQHGDNQRSTNDTRAQLRVRECDYIKQTLATH
jgi:hypothetical protein